VRIVEFFAARPLVEKDPEKALRVSWYLGDAEESRHVRFSVWSGRPPRAEAAVSLADDEAERLACFLEDAARVSRQPTVR
jgi:hypothetical protein